MNDMMGTDWDGDNMNDMLHNFSGMEFDCCALILKIRTKLC